MNLNEIGQRHHEWAVSVGWVKNTTPIEALGLVCSEVGEAINECRGHQPTEQLQYELADIILRTSVLAVELGINLEEAIEEKMKLNRARGNRGRIK